MSKSRYDEGEISQKPALEVLKNMGYEYIPREEAEAMRGNLYNVLLTDILKQKLMEFNSYEYKGKNYRFSAKNIEQAIKDLDEPLVEGLVRTNEKIYDSLMLGRSYEENLPDGARRFFSLKYIDWDIIHNNVFHVTEEFNTERVDGRGHARPDIVLFVNGIPLGVIECKKASIEIKQGISQMLRNQGMVYIPQLFKYSQILMATNKNEAKYATCNTPERFWSAWKEEDEEWLQEQLSKAVFGRLPTKQDKSIIALFHPARLMEITKYFVVFDLNVKKIARYQQYFGVKAITAAIEEKDEEGNRQSGVIWHAQGSGKSISMVMFAKYIMMELHRYNPKVLVVTDRINLDKQIHATFNHTRLKADRATTGKHLIDLINDSQVDIVTTLVHKFDTAAREQKPILGRDIFILVDESHRTQYGELHIKMKRVFPNACYLGFTGTPLMRKEKNTMLTFGSLLHSYTIADGVEDKIIVPLLYEGRMVEQTVNQKAIDNRLEMITKRLNEKQKEEVMDKWSQFEKIASSEQRIALIANDINEHFLRNYKTKNSHFKAMLAASGRPDAVRYLHCFEQLGDLNAAVVISPPDQREGYEEVNATPDDKVKRFWLEMMDRYGSEENYEDTLKNEFVNGDELDLMIVVDKLLTGFDAPRATVMYVDKPMKEHTLLQAIARVNRIYEGKDFGLIIDYRGLLKELDEAMLIYAGAGLENFDAEDLKGAIYDVISVIGSLRQHYTDLTNIFIPIKNKGDREEYEVLLENERLRKEFYDVLRNFGNYLKIALGSERVYNALEDGEIEKYKRDFRFYQDLRRSVMRRYSDTIDYKEYEPQMQKLMDSYIAAEDLIKITKPIDILDRRGFEEELERLGSPRAKADTIQSRMKRSINKNMPKDPHYYKKFSERIEEVIEAYKEKRINELERLQALRSIMENYQEGHPGFDYPDTIKGKPDAQAFYGVTSEVFEKGPVWVVEGKETGLSTEQMAELALKIEGIVARHTKVDWHNNVDVHNRIKQEIDDLFFEFSKENNIEIDLAIIDNLLDETIKVAINRY